MPISPQQVARLRGTHRKGRHSGPAPAADHRHPPARARTRARPHRPRHLRAYALGVALLLFLLIAADAGAYGRLWAFLDHGAGVLALVSLTATVLWGLAATDRRLLRSAHRILAQGVHRGLALAGLGFLALHIAVKVAEQRIGPTAAAVPFADPGRPVLLGLGTLAGYMFLAVAVTGAVRSRFAAGGASRQRSRWWRALHMAAYPAWGAALLHGLKSGRPAAGWVTAGYALALAGAAVALLLRLRADRVPAPPPPPARPPQDPRPVPDPETTQRMPVVLAAPPGPSVPFDPYAPPPGPVVPYGPPGPVRPLEPAVPAMPAVPPVSAGPVGLPVAPAVPVVPPMPVLPPVPAGPPFSGGSRGEPLGAATAGGGPW
ncbi:hypothetical protein LG634_18120 [Streptomyces bambusae]|uniref:hypothetical protein n=1 Tax=Streptomyces bambusae TaxID=1550616 RepID=UPI001CFDE9CA|nr:hypothetical protein [Streptomyces bambusae]MCB5166749.1 hypothetical protein [Streptomyces bambusae]